MGLKTLWKDEDDKKITLEETKFIFQQADIKLKDSIDTSQLIVGRTVTLASISIGIMITLVAYLFANWDKAILDVFSLLLLKVSVFVYFILSISIVSNINPSKYKIQGVSPEVLYNDHFFSPEFENTNDNPNNRLLEYYKVLIVGHNDSINKNKTLNINRWKRFKISLWLLTFSPIIIFGLFMLICIVR